MSRRVCLALLLTVCLASCAEESAEPEVGDGPPAVKDVPAERTSTATPVAAPTSTPSEKSSGPYNLIRAPQLFLTAEEIEEGWIQLFDGQTLFGWKPNNGVNWSMHEGTITADTGDPGLLLTSVPFADYEFRCDFRLETGGNSGLFFHTQPDSIKPASNCYELNIADDNPFPTVSLVQRKRIETPVFVEGEWHTYHVTLVNSKMHVALDGKPIFEYEDDTENKLVSGFIGLQKNAGKIEFRNVALKPRQQSSLFGGTDLKGWHVVPGNKSNFKVSDGTIHVSDGPGFLETDQTWDDFVLQLSAKVNGDGLNSGVFFRCMRGTEEGPSNGYEMQIHNGFKGDDRSQPIDSGSGAIFRRTKARWVIGDDRQWLHATLVAHGPRISTWVNGIQMTDWTDERDEDENPRRGRRLTAGHISLQGHDPTTDLDFKALRISDYPKGE